jgi:hypothetical protein
MKLQRVKIPSDPETETFFKEVFGIMEKAEIPFLMGGAYAFGCYTGIMRMTKDLDIFILPKDVYRALEAVEKAGFKSELTFPIWLAKAYKDPSTYVDFIFRAGNGRGEVDGEWFQNARETELWDYKIKLCPPEESIWQKSFIRERWRYDGADVAHYFFHCAQELDWHRLVGRFAEDWRVLFSELVLFGFIYPDKRHLVPEWVFQELILRLQKEMSAENGAETRKVCRGTLLSHVSFLVDVFHAGYKDYRFEPHGSLTQQEISAWESERLIEDPKLLDKYGISSAPTETSAA